MYDLNLPISEGVSIIAEPDGNQCRLTIRLTWDALEELLSSVVGNIEPYKRAEAQRKRQAKAARNDAEERIKASSALASKISAGINARRAEGLSRVEAVRAEAASRNLSAFMAETYARIATKAERKARDKRIFAASRAGKRNREIAKAEGVSTGTVAKVLRQLRDQARELHSRDRS